MMRGLNHTILLVAHQAALEFAGYSHAPLLLLRVINEICQLPSAMTISNIMRSRFLDRCPLMGWSGRAPAPPASEAGKGRQRQGAHHVSDTQYRDRRDRH